MCGASAPDMDFDVRDRKSGTVWCVRDTLGTAPFLGQVNGLGMHRRGRVRRFNNGEMTDKDGPVLMDIDGLMQ